jgi:hypothetical protein
VVGAGGGGCWGGGGHGCGLLRGGTFQRSAAESTGGGFVILPF